MPDVIVPVADEAWFEVCRAAASPNEIPALLASWISERARVQALTRCRAPRCSVAHTAGGLCAKHYQRVQYYIRLGLLDRGWLIRHGRLQGVDISGVTVESLGTLPKPAKLLAQADRVTLWFFDYPKSQQERECLLVKGAPLHSPTESPL